MTEREAIEIIKFVPLYRYECELEKGRQSDLFQALNVAIKALEDIQRYRKLGCVEAIEDELYSINAALEFYKAIGSVNECREAVYRQRPMQIKKINVAEYYCPNCGSENNCDQGKVYDEYCPNCGQKIYQMEE